MRREEVVARANAEWSMDFMSETLFYGRRFLPMNILDETRPRHPGDRHRYLDPGWRVIRILDQLLGGVRAGSSVV